MPYLGKTPSQATRQRYYKTASAGDTSVSGTMTTGGTLTFTDGEFVDVSVNGVALVAGTDYNTSTANTIAGLSALSAGDQVEIVVYDTFSVFSGDVDSNMSVGGNLTVTGSAEIPQLGGVLDTNGNNIEFPDSSGAEVNRLKFGAGDDLQIYHDGSDSYINDTGTGNLRLAGSSQVDIISSGGEFMAKFIADGAATLYHNNAAKISTTATGIDVQGQVIATKGSTGTLATFTDGVATNFTLKTDGSSVGTFGTEAGSTQLAFMVANTEAARFDGSRNFLIGKTALGTANDGLQVKPAGELVVTRDGNHSLILNRKSSDGNIALFQKDGTTVGTIGSVVVNTTLNGFIVLEPGSGGAGIAGYGGASNGALVPCNESGAIADNAKDWGASSARWDDIFASNGTIQTSDENEKQNIASLTSAEITAAKAISKLFKTFKWKDKVTAKGDAARTHTGVIAQEVQAAMSAAGLDATKYAFWCSDTWTNDDGSEQTRMGVRYPELMSFVLSSIEDRITALENAQ